ncbi:MAG: tRNA lysidine(34) synthetase TilS [Defluviitaleaceae bacterium]|nr:tRNA lysidine(34) synthetase TilS [Defluviitaleaceae bacterium]MCL2836893.1 tRNA lysidine(34) synthetase TilS [Defluviitaleaceae bacterium]
MGMGKASGRGLPGFWETVREHGLLERGERVVLGLSGGADSMALFHMLAGSGLCPDILNVHINHGLRGEESDGDEEFCAAVSKKYGAGFRVYRADISALARERGCTEEEAGREFRYAAFEEAAGEFGAGKIAVAHNRDDNAETVIMRFLRGTGLKGLSGIPVRRGMIVRPLLFTGRDDIEAYLAEQGLSWRLDSTNMGNAYTRNKVRNILMPIVREHFNPGAAEGITAAVEMYGREDAFLEKLAEDAVGKSLVKRDGHSVTLCSQKLSGFDPVIINRAIRIAYAMLAKSMKDLSRAHVEKASALLNAERGKRIDLPGGVTARAGNGELVIEKRGDNAPLAFQYTTDLSENLFIGERKVMLSFNSGYDVKDFKKLYTIKAGYDRISEGLVFRTRFPGDRIFLAGVGRQRIKDFLCGKKLSQGEKDRLFYLADGADIIAVFGEAACLRVSDAYDPGKRGEFVTITVHSGN